MVKTRLVGFRVSEEQYFLLRLWARQDGLGVSSYVRMRFFRKERAAGKEMASEGEKNGY